jgi:hypothetical protein
MKVGDLVKLSTAAPRHLSGEVAYRRVYLVMRTQACVLLKVWLYPDPYGTSDHTNDLNFYYEQELKVVYESR